MKRSLNWTIFIIRIASHYLDFRSKLADRLHRHRLRLPLLPQPHPNLQQRNRFIPGSASASTFEPAYDIAGHKGRRSKVIMNKTAGCFGYPPQIQGADANFAGPFFERLVRIGDGETYNP